VVARADDDDGDDGDAEARVGQRRRRRRRARAHGDGDGACASGEFYTTCVRARAGREASRVARARAEGSDTTTTATTARRLGPREVGTEDGAIATRDVADVADGGVDDVTCWMAFGDDDGSDACADATTAATTTMGVRAVEATGGGAREASRRAGSIEDARGAVEAYEGAPLAFDEVRVCVCSFRMCVRVTWMCALRQRVKHPSRSRERASIFSPGASF